MLGLLGVPLGFTLIQLLPSVPMTLVTLPVGAAVLTLAVVTGIAAWRRSDGDGRWAARAWSALGLHAFLFAASIALGRLSEPSSSGIVEIYLSMYSTTLTLFTVAAIGLGVLASVRTNSPRCAWWACAAAGVCLVSSYAATLPRLLEIREIAARARYCVELIDYLESGNSCFLLRPTPEQQVLLHRTCLRAPRRGLRFESGAGHVRRALTTREADGKHDWVVSGCVALDDGRAPDAIVLSRDASGGCIFAIEPDLRVEGDRARWSVRLYPRDANEGAPARHGVGLRPR